MKSILNDRNCSQLNKIININLNIDIVYLLSRPALYNNNGKYNIIIPVISIGCNDFDLFLS